MKYLVYPVGYNPLIKLDKEDWQKTPGVHTHSPEAEKQRQLASMVKECQEEPIGRWYQEIE